MAAPISNQCPSNTPGPSATSWSRSGEPGSAFNGVGRGGRGRGPGRGRHGRSSRGGPRETKVVGTDSSSDKSSLVPTLKTAPIPSTKPAAVSSPTATEKKSVVPNVAPSGRPRRNLRRIQQLQGRNETPSVGIDAPTNPSSSKSASRRRRSQTGKTVQMANTINVSSRDINQLRSQCPSTGTVLHVAPIKDAPPHLTSTINKHDDVDAVLDRVGVAHVDDRAHTPGSHIDWAGDDDDSLPDLDDWGITSVKVAINENGLMSPLGVNNLRPLPDIVTDADSSPHRETLILTKSSFSDQIETTPHQANGSTNGILTSGKFFPFPNSSFLNVLIHYVIKDDAHVAAPITTTQEPLVSAPASAKVSLCTFPPPYVAGSTLQDEVALLEPKVNAPVAKVELGLAAYIHSPDGSSDKEDPFSNILGRNGLSASIHAPHAVDMMETKSIPSDISVHSRVSPEHQTHRYHATGRPPSSLRADDSSRPSRSGYNTPRGGLSAYHARTHSTPPAGSHTRRSPAHRPVLTGDAISRLAKTIGGTTPSPARVSAISTAQE
ncbi:hypothetical protein C0993_004051 [Termitomyces sp. T159_Od127]|nr:hypothetical protein C0993_004051 [Termitomyces sp. T159_Od127]